MRYRLNKRKYKKKIKKRSLRKLKRSRINPKTIQFEKNQYDVGYDSGYNNGYNDAFQAIDKDRNKEFDEGFAKGIYTGGEGYVDELLPHDVILPEFSVKQIIKSGLKTMKSHYFNLLLSSEISKRIGNALDHKTPLSIIRLGDGELLTLAQDLILSTEEVKKRGSFLGYAGVEIPDLITRDQLAQSIRKSNVVGIPKQRVENFSPLMFPVFKAHGIDYKQLNLTFSTINYVLYTDGLLSGLMQGRRILVIGNQAQGLSALLVSHGIQIAEPISQVAGVKDVPRIMSETAQRDFDMALVSAGIAAVMITERIATELGKVAIDFGHLADSLISGEAAWK